MCDNPDCEACNPTLEQKMCREHLMTTLNEVATVIRSACDSVPFPSIIDPAVFGHSVILSLLRLSLHATPSLAMDGIKTATTDYLSGGDDLEGEPLLVDALAFRTFLSSASDE